MKIRKIAIALFIILIIGAGIQAVHAEEDIGAILMSWFDDKTEESITDIETTIAEEQQKQTDRLTEELQMVIEEAESKMDVFVEEEKAKRVQEIQQYTDELIEEMTIDSSRDKVEIRERMDLIIEKAIIQLDQVRADYEEE